MFSAFEFAPPEFCREEPDHHTNSSDQYNQSKQKLDLGDNQKYGANEIEQKLNNKHNGRKGTIILEIYET